MTLSALACALMLLGTALALALGDAAATLVFGYLAAVNAGAVWMLAA